MDHLPNRRGPEGHRGYIAIGGNRLYGGELHFDSYIVHLYFRCLEDLFCFNNKSDRTLTSDNPTADLNLLVVETSTNKTVRTSLNNWAKIALETFERIWSFLTNRLCSGHTQTP